jgi:Short C-terminal domain
MLRRGRGRSGPGVMGSMARAAVVASTATAVSRAQRTANAESMRRERVAERASSPPSAEPAAATEQVVTVLKELAALKDQGVLTAEEFAAQKARLLG